MTQLSIFIGDHPKKANGRLNHSEHEAKTEALSSWRILSTYSLIRKLPYTGPRIRLHIAGISARIGGHGFPCRIPYEPYLFIGRLLRILERFIIQEIKDGSRGWPRAPGRPMRPTSRCEVWPKIRGVMLVWPPKAKVRRRSRAGEHSSQHELPPA